MGSVVQMEVIATDLAAMKCRELEALGIFVDVGTTSVTAAHAVKTIQREIDLEIELNPARRE